MMMTRSRLATALATLVSLAAMACGTADGAEPSATTAAPTSTPTSSAAISTPSIAGGLALGPGLTDFTLSDANTGGEVTLSKAAADGPVVLVLYRAFWCTFCRAQLNELQEQYGEIRSLGGEVLAVSMDNLDQTQGLVQQVGIEFPVLYSSKDPAIPLAYSGLMDNGMNAFPSTYIIGTDGQLKWEYVGDDYTDYAPTAEVLAQLEALAG